LNDVQVSFSEFVYQTSFSLNTYNQFSQIDIQVIIHLLPQLTDCAQAEYRAKSNISSHTATGSSVCENTIVSFHSYHHNIIFQLYIVQTVGVQTAEVSISDETQALFINTGLNPLLLTINIQ
jgi:hypothetical protein